MPANMAPSLDCIDLPERPDLAELRPVPSSRRPSWALLASSSCSFLMSLNYLLSLYSRSAMMNSVSFVVISSSIASSSSYSSTSGILLGIFLSCGVLVGLSCDLKL